MYYVESGWIDSAPPPPLRIQTYALRADNRADEYTLRALISDAEQRGALWFAFTSLPPQNSLRTYAGRALTSVFVATGCDWLGLDEDGRHLIYGRTTAVVPSSPLRIVANPN